MKKAIQSFKLHPHRRTYSSCNLVWIAPGRAWRTLAMALRGSMPNSMSRRAAMVPVRPSPARQWRTIFPPTARIRRSSCPAVSHTYAYDSHSNWTGTGFIPLQAGPRPQTGNPARHVSPVKAIIVAKAFSPRRFFRKNEVSVVDSKNFIAPQ